MSAMIRFPLAGPSRRNLSRLAAGWLAVITAASLTGCYRPAPVAHATLRVTAQGELELDGTAVSPGLLGKRVTALKAAKGGGDLVVTIEPAPAADVAHVRDAVQAIQRAQARVAFSGDVQALKATPGASGQPAD
jgi:hypothetical protein